MLCCTIVDESLYHCAAFYGLVSLISRRHTPRMTLGNWEFVFLDALIPFSHIRYVQIQPSAQSPGEAAPAALTQFMFIQKFGPLDVSICAWQPTATKYCTSHRVRPDHKRS